MTPSQEARELLAACPFCGGEDVSVYGPYGWHHQWGISHSCATFYSGTSEFAKGFATEAAAITAWNTRAALLAFNEFGDAEGVVWSGLSSQQRERAYRTADAILALNSGEGWRDISGAPVNEIVDWWIACASGGDGWRKTGMREVAMEPLCIIDEEGLTYWPHENGGFATHWQPLPAPPAGREDL